MAEEIIENNVAEKPAKKKGQVFKKVLGILGWVFLGALSVYAAINIIDVNTGYKVPFFGTRSSVIVSQSMSCVNTANTYINPNEVKTIQKYDLITTVNYKSYDEIQLYDVLTYTGEEGALICHRVVNLYEDNGKQYIVTRGDANASDDTPFTYEMVRGKVVNVTPKVGYAVAFVQSPYLFIALFGSAFFIFLGKFIYTIDTEKKQKKALETNVEETSTITEESKPEVEQAEETNN